MISFILIALYIIYIVINYGIPKSISASYYSLKHKAAFSLVLLLSIILSFNQFMDVTPDNFKFLPFIFCSGILFVAAAPNFNSSDLTLKVHCVAAIISFVTSQIWAAIIDPTPLILWLFVLFYIIVKLRKYKHFSLVLENTCIKFWTEIAMLLVIFSEII